MPPRDPRIREMSDRERKNMLVSRCRREKTLWNCVNYLAQFCECKVFVAIEHDGQNIKRIFHSHPETDFPGSWSYIVSIPCNVDGALPQLISLCQQRDDDYKEPILRTPESMGPVKKRPYERTLPLDPHDQGAHDIGDAEHTNQLDEAGLRSGEHVDDDFVSDAQSALQLTGEPVWDENDSELGELMDVEDDFYGVYTADDGICSPATPTGDRCQPAMQAGPSNESRGLLSLLPVKHSASSPLRDAVRHVLGSDRHTASGVPSAMSQPQQNTSPTDQAPSMALQHQRITKTLTGQESGQSDRPKGAAGPPKSKPPSSSTPPPHSTSAPVYDTRRLVLTSDSVLAFCFYSSVRLHPGS